MTDNGQQLYDMRNPRCEEQLERMERVNTEGKDIFDPEIIEQPILFETDHWYVTENAFPYWGAEYHFLVISLLPIYTLDEMSPEMWEDLRKIWRKLIKKYKIQGGALGFRFGEDSQRSGSTIKRLHVHLIQPEKGKKTKFTIGGKTCMGVHPGVRNLKVVK